MLPSISLFGLFELPTYGMIFFAAFVIAVIIALRMAPAYGVLDSDLLYASIYAAIGLAAGAKLMYFISKLPQIIRHFPTFVQLIKVSPVDALAYAFGGLVFYGGLLGAAAGVYVYCRQYKILLYPFMDITAPLIPFVHGFGRIGCFMAGCCYGIEYHGPFSIQFPYNEMIPELSEVSRFPVQLLEAGMNFIISAVLFILMKKKKTKTGQLLGIYLIYYTIARFCLEFLRGDLIRGQIFGISTSQIISFILLPAGIILVRGKWIEKKLNRG